MFTVLGDGDTITHDGHDKREQGKVGNDQKWYKDSPRPMMLDHDLTRHAGPFQRHHFHECQEGRIEPCKVIIVQRRHFAKEFGAQDGKNIKHQYQNKRDGTQRRSCLSQGRNDTFQTFQAGNQSKRPENSKGSYHLKGIKGPTRDNDEKIKNEPTVRKQILTLIDQLHGQFQGKDDKKNHIELFKSSSQIVVVFYGIECCNTHGQCIETNEKNNGLLHKWVIHHGPTGLAKFRHLAR
mmetsp:Transcript_14816/g.28224  ORF Transcript_14816/g.28224 Transcript_14816/m.28224 type:complete len:237 (+) Transcript_14816:423-1133(+)